MYGVFFDLISPMLPTNSECIKYFNYAILLKVYNRRCLFEVVNYPYPISQYNVVISFSFVNIKLGTRGRTCTCKIEFLRLTRMLIPSHGHFKIWSGRRDLHSPFPASKAAPILTPVTPSRLLTFIWSAMRNSNPLLMLGRHANHHIFLSRTITFFFLRSDEFYDNWHKEHHIYQSLLKSLLYFF